MMATRRPGVPKDGMSGNWRTRDGGGRAIAVRRWNRPAVLYLHSMRIHDSGRSERLAALGSRAFDLLVIGGGITGCGIARDAALRGLSVALVEKDDFASGTS
ncbi:MAG TPA: FAD-dependent oxidoreductase, partial [Gemmatimonadaceae bacterium]